jgi:predicted nuclease of predicted toxin-antitoxin system
MRLAADENFDYGILRGLLRNLPGLDLIMAQDAGMTGASDTHVLEWAAAENRELLTQDAQTMPRFAYIRVEQGEPMPGVIVVP